MRDASRRPMGRLCYWALAVVAAFSFRLTAAASPASPQSGPATTTVTDTVYLANGAVAKGTLIITWPAFLTASGAAVAAGTTNVTLAANGTFSVGLVPNVGANPAGVYYTVVYQLGPGEVKTEYWVVPATSPANLAAVRTTPGAGVAGQPVSLQYVNSALAGVVHLSGTETITGTKTFSTAPSVPAPSSAGQVANKAYVDQSVSTVGAGNYLPTAGGTMTGPITLPGAPAAPMQAATKQYVDTGLAAKADLITGLVPASELGTGQATAGSCLLGNGTWGACGGGSGAGNISTTPTASQNIAQPGGTQFSTNNLANIRYVTSSWNWAQTPADNLSTPGAKTIHLAPCPLGLDTTASANYYTYKVYISGTGTPEAVAVTGGNCPAGAASGTINVTTANAHAAGYSVGSASSGIQEAWNDAWPGDSVEAAWPYVKLAANQQYNVYATVYLRGRGGMLDGAGAQIVCSTRDRCLYVGTTLAYPAGHHHKLYNLSGSSTVNVDGVQVASVAATNGTYTVTTAGNHPFIAGDTVDCEYYSQTSGQHWVAQVVSVPGATSFTVNFGSATFSAGAATFGFCGLLNTFLENNSDHVVAQDINVFQINPGGTGYFSYGIVNDNDQQFIVERAANRTTPVFRATANFPMGAFLYQRTDQGNAGITYVHDSEFSGVNCATGGGNGFVMTDSVCQGFPTYGVRYFGGYQPATLQNVYEESTGGSVNPLYGYAAQAGFVLQGGTGSKILGSFPVSGYSPGFATGGGSAAERSYFVVPRSSTLGYGPVLFIGWAEPASGSTSIALKWPSPELLSSTGLSLGTVTWDVLVTTGVTAAPPWGSGMYAVATNISGACGTNGMCTFTDTQAAPSGYTVAAQRFTPVFWFWPVSLVINGTTVLMEQAGAAPSAVANQGTTGIAIVAEQCTQSGVNQQRSPIWVSCLASETSGGTGSIATVLQEVDAANNGPAVNSKGRLNLASPILAPNDLITLQDSNLGKTLAAVGERPSNDAGDMAIGLDQTGGLAQRAATSISSYINALPSGTNYQERLTAAGKTFNVPVTVNGNLSVNGGTVTLPVTGTGSQCLHVNATGVVSGTGADCGSGGGGSGTVSSGQAAQVAMYSGNGTTVSGDSALTDNGTMLNYAGSGGITAATGTFNGNVTVNGQLNVAGPWVVSSPVPGMAMAAASPGTSALGISNDGNFYVSANGGIPQQVATAATSSYFSNLVQEDANNLGEYNPASGTTAQNLHVYSSYTNSSSWQRTSLGFDPTDNYAVVRSESTGSAPGLGFWIGSGKRWVIDGTYNLKPWQDIAYNIGSFSGAAGIGLRPATVYAGGNPSSNSGFELGKFANASYELCNDTTNGTVLNGLAVLTANGCAMKPASAAIPGIIGVVIANAGTSGTVTLARTGSAYCSFDATATVVGDYVVQSSAPSGGFYFLCHDAGSTPPSGTQIVGRVMQATVGGTIAQMFFDMPGSVSSSAGAVTSVFGRAGAVTAASGDYTCGQVTGCTPNTTTVNGHGLTGNVTVSASDLTTGTLPHGQLPALVSGDIPNNAANTTGTAGGLSLNIAESQVTNLSSDLGNKVSTSTTVNGHALSGNVTVAPADLAAGALANGMTATTQSPGDNSAKLATTQYVQNFGCTMWYTQSTAQTGTPVAFPTASNKAFLMGMNLPCNLATTKLTYDVVVPDNTGNTYDVGLYNSSGTLVVHIGPTAGTTFAPSTGWKTVNWAAGATLPGGRYYLLLTTSCSASCATIAGGPSGGGLTYNANNSFSVTTGGTLPANITPPADSWSAATLASVVVQ